MPLIRRADHETRARNAIVLNLSDVRVQMDEVIARAQSEATRLVEEARKERERLISSAAAEGRAAGHAEGLALGRREGADQARRDVVETARSQLADVQGAWQVALGRFEATRRSLLEDAREDVVRLALAIAGRVVKRSIEVSPDVVVGQVAEALALVTKAHRLVIAVHPDDLPIVELAWPTLVDRFAESTECVLVADESLSRGSCVVRKADRGGGGVRGEIDARIETQIERIARALVAEAPGVAGASASKTEPGGDDAASPKEPGA